MPFTLSAFADESSPLCDGQITALKNAGITRLDVRTIANINISVLPLEHAKKILEKLHAANISIAMFGSPIGKIDLAEPLDIDLDKLKHLAQLAPIFNCTSVRIFSYFNAKARLSADEFRKESLRRLRALKELAQDLNLTLYHENESHIFGDHPAEVLTIAHELREPNGHFKLVFDFGNFTAGHDNAWNAWLLLRDHIDAIHLKDNRWTKPANPADPPCPSQLEHVPVGQGDGSVKEIIADAVKRNFSGPISVEAHLFHSPAVIATDASGIPNQTFESLNAPECFQIACTAAKKLLAAAGAVIV